MAKDSIETTPRTSKMGDDELLSLISSYERASLGSQVAAGATISSTVYPSQNTLTTLEVDRYNAINGYYARPLGDEIENRSQVVLPALRDTIEWIMPQLMRMFCGAKSVCRFDPEGEDDETAADQETQVVNHVFMRQNNGFFVLHDFFKDTLLMRNGYVEVYTKEDKSVKEETYTGLDQIQLASLLQDIGDEKIEVIGQKEYMKDLILPLPQGDSSGQSPKVVAQIPTWDLKIRRTGTTKNICVTPLPPEEMRVSARAREGMEDIPFSMHMSTMARSDLITEGYDKAIVQSAASGRPNWIDMDSLARNQVVDQLSVEDPSDFSMQDIEIRKTIIKVDWDGDGVAELRRVVILGDKIAENEMVEETPFVSGAAIRMPHRHTGISIYDLVMDLQVLSSQLWRQGIDNLKNANNTRVAVDWRNCNFDDLLTSRPGAPIRGNGPPSQWIQQLTMPSNLTEQVLPALQYIDDLRTQRTGIGKGTMGMDPDELQNVTKGGQLAAMSNQTMIVELIARLLAEGVKGIFMKIHGELMRHQDKPLELEIAGNWVKTDPSQWRRRTKVSPNVGLGSGNREELRTNVQLLGQAQTTLAQMGLVGPKQAYETFKMLCESLGFSNPERFALDPAGQEYQQHMQQQAQQKPQVPPQVQAAQIRAATDIQKAQFDSQQAQLDAKQKIATAQIEAQASTQRAQAEVAHAALQAQQDRQVSMADQDVQMTQTLIKAIAPIVAQQLKQDPGVNAGQVLAQDVKGAKSGLSDHDEKISGMIDALHQHIQSLGKPKVATLPDGRQITIQ